jgi:LPS-assembly protein
LGVDASWPFIRPTSTGAIILEPLLQLAVSNESDRDPLIPNEDSLSFEFDETNLFEPNKFPGFDRFEGGVRLNAGARATAEWGRGLNASLLVGRSFRAEEDTIFPRRTGLRERASDWIVAASARPIEAVNIRTRARLDNENFAIRRIETNASYSRGRAFVAVNHLQDVDPPLSTTSGANVRRNEADAFALIPITRRFSAIANAVVDLTEDTWRRGEIGIRYQDECTLLDIVYERENTRNRTLGPSDSIRVRLTLATLGDIQER